MLMQAWRDELAGRIAVLGLTAPAALQTADGQYLFKLNAVLAVREAAAGIRDVPPGSMLETLSRKFGIDYDMLDMPPEDEHEREIRCDRERRRAEDYIERLNLG